MDIRAVVDLIRFGLAAGADDTVRARASAVWTELAVLLAQGPLATPAVAPTAAAAPMPAAAMPAVPMPAAPMPAAPMPAAPMSAVPPPSTHIARAARALRQLPPEQLLDLALQRLRAALPPGVTVPTPTGIQFPLVPIPPGSSGKR